MFSASIVVKNSLTHSLRTCGENLTFLWLRKRRSCNNSKQRIAITSVHYCRSGCRTNNRKLNYVATETLFLKKAMQCNDYKSSVALLLTFNTDIWKFSGIVYFPQVHCGVGMIVFLPGQ